MKVYIEYSNTSSPYGGGNQFLNRLKIFLIKKNLYAAKPENSDVILINAFENFRKVIRLKKIFPDKLFIHRVNGITRVYNNFFDRRDYLTQILNNYVSEATIFQSNWCKFFNKKYGLKSQKYETVILNSATKVKLKNKKKIKGKIKIVASSWSSNWNKGFGFFLWLDRNLDFKNYELTFIGNSPVSFDNIKIISPQKSKELHKKLKKYDIYLSASKKDACSNSILEAIACGLPVIAFDDGGNPEIIKGCGELYSSRKDFILKLKKLITNYKKYRFNILKKEDYSLDKYLKFIEKIFLKKIVIKKNLNHSDIILIYILLVKVFCFSFISKFYTSVNNYMRKYLLRVVYF